MNKFKILLCVLGVTFAVSANADMCPTANYTLYSPAAGDGSVVNGAWVANKPADEA